MNATEQLLADLVAELGALAAGQRDLLEVLSGQGIAVPRRVVLDVAHPFDTWKTTGGMFHSVKVDNPNAYPLYVRFDGTRPTLGNTDEIIPPESGRIITRPFDEVSVGVDDAAVAAVTPQYAFVTTYARQLQPFSYELSALASGADAIVGTTLVGVADDGSAPVKVGGVYRVTPAALADGQRGELLLGSRGAAAVQLKLANATGDVQGLASEGDGHANTSVLLVGADQYVYNGATWDRARAASVFKNIVSVAVVAGTPQTIWTPAAGKKFRLMGWHLSASVAARVLFTEQNVGEILRTGTLGVDLAQSSPVAGNGLLATNANDALQLNVSVNATLNGYVFGVEE